LFWFAFAAGCGWCGWSCGLGCPSGFVLVAWRAVDWCEVVVFVAASVRLFDDVIYLVGSFSSADVADAVVLLHDSFACCGPSWRVAVVGGCPVHGVVLIFCLYCSSSLSCSCFSMRR
jgi:hypothetical protein